MKNDTLDSLEPSSDLPYRNLAVRYGFIMGVSMIIFQLALILSGNLSNNSLSWLAYVITIGVSAVAMTTYKSENGGFMKFSQGLGLGTLSSFISSIVSTLFMMVYYILDPSIVQDVLAQVREQLEANPQMTEEIIAMSMEWAEKMFQPQWLLLIGIFGGLLGGFIISLIVSAIVKKDRPTAF